MIVPEFWAEARLHHRDRSRRITIRRFGWSDASEEEARANAEARAREAMDLALAGKPIARIDLKRAYNGSEGVPIREEIVSRHGETVVTRNSYGALCLNTPNVLFVDVDFASRSKHLFAWTIALFSLPLVLSMLSDRFRAALAIAGFIWGGLVIALVFTIDRRIIKWRGGPEGVAMTRVERFSQRHPFWSLLVYRTPLGLRILAAHRTFDTDDPEVDECFRELGADEIYVRMCKRQKCFRARVSPKPWRVGLKTHLRPRPGVWPLKPERMPERRSWIEAYERASQGYAACEFVRELGAAPIDPAVRSVRDLHDALSGCRRGLPLA